MKKIFWIVLFVSQVLISAPINHYTNLLQIKSVTVNSVQDSLHKDSSKTELSKIKLNGTTDKLFYLKNILEITFLYKGGFYLPNISSLDVQQFSRFGKYSDIFIRPTFSEYFNNMYKLRYGKRIGLLGRILNYAQGVAATYFLYKSISKYGLGFDNKKLLKQ